ncbi:response regulator transcription factor [Cellulosilyticum sp. I15G10I2]|uniref:response regulator transcription factor n=1 Tax=Cellulosilyticum sp. I15G10I2 TaxID=1892843 RepID=UPI00085BDFD3|nr:response regulator [Cellulosilyticum sp. I15G10I2]
MKIIIVDDEILIRKGIATSVNWEEIGIDEVIEASNGEQALELILKNNIDIVLTDIKMPKMDGLTLIEQLKLCSPYTVAIVLSCVNDMDVVRQALKFGGALDYIPKLSMTTEELVDTINRAITYVRKNNAYVPLDKNKILPSFFTLEHEQSLRSAIEYGDLDTLNKVIKKILKSAYILKEFWKESREWEDIFGVFSNVIKKYDIDPNKFFSNYKTIRQIIQDSHNIDEAVKSLGEIALDIKTSIEQERKENYDAVINKAVIYINKYYNQNIKLKDVADHVSMSESYFSKYFKKIMNTNFIDYINQIKIERSKELLARKKITIQEVSELMGYTNCSYFTQVFKELEGVTPKQYQKNILIKNNT